jgi:hypothetical protein
MYEYPFRVPAYFALIIRSLVTLEGIAIGVDPEFKVLSKAYPYIAKRLLTDPAPELRTSLKELLFKDGSFRWNRLENLLQNAKGSREYDLGGSLDQAVDYLFSERGEFIRVRLADEVINSVDVVGQNLWQSLTMGLQQRLGWAVEDQTPIVAENQKTIEHMQRIWAIIQETEGVDQSKLLSLLPRILAKPETQRMGQSIVGGIAQRFAVRFVREVLLTEPPAGLEPIAAPRLAARRL